MTQLDDTSLMPFGKFANVPMQEVPVNYLHWLWSTSGMKNDRLSPVADYIRRNLHALQLENKDLIWD